MERRLSEDEKIRMQCEARKDSIVIDDIVKDLDEDISMIQKICDAVENCGNRYDEKEIYDELNRSV